MKEFTRCSICGKEITETEPQPRYIDTCHKCWILHGSCSEGKLDREGGGRMTTEELHKILDDENKGISLEEYQNIIWELRNDTTLMLLDKNLDIKKSSWYMGESNGFQIALDLSEHIE